MTTAVTKQAFYIVFVRVKLRCGNKTDFKKIKTLWNELNAIVEQSVKVLLIIHKLLLILVQYYFLEIMIKLNKMKNIDKTN